MLSIYTTYSVFSGVNKFIKSLPELHYFIRFKIKRLRKINHEAYNYYFINRTYESLRSGEVLTWVKYNGKPTNNKPPAKLPKTVGISFQSK